MTAAEVRAKYPNPLPDTEPALRPTDWPLDAYCVGGAACRYATGKTSQRFPCRSEIAETLGIQLAEAEAITTANDEGDFDLAFELLDKALKARAS